MTGRQWSSPFGARPLAAAPMLAEIALRKQQDAMARARAEGSDAGNAGRVCDKWQLLRALSEARGRFALSDRAIAVLEALLSFHPGKEIEGAKAVIVFPSNRELSLRSRGMAAATLRRHLASLVAAGLILRRDSPNGKRFRRLDAQAEGGADAFGFDLSPLALKSGAIFEAAEAEAQVARDVARARRAISLHRRDVAKVIEAALAESRQGDWPAFAARLAESVRGLTRRLSLAELGGIEAELLRLRAETETAYLASLTNEEMSANESENERHYQNSKADPSIESNGHRHNAGRDRSAPPLPRHAVAPAMPSLERKSLGFDLALVLKLCPDITHYAREPVRAWADLVATASLVRGFLGVSEHAWREACAAMGEIPAAVVVACMLQRSDRIRSAGGYLRDLTTKAREGRFTVAPMLRALESG